MIVIYKIYKYTNNVNNKIYIGQTKNSLKRRAGAKGENYKESRIFWNAINKYGWENFKGEILIDNLTIEEANEYETYYIKYYNSTDRNIGYNLDYGGNNKTTSLESCKLISEKAKERYKIKENNPMYGKRHSDDVKNKMSEIKIGDKNPMYGSKWNDNQINANRKGWCYEWTEERRKEKSIISKEISKKWSKRVKCLEDDLVFETITEASKHYDVKKSTLSGHLHNYQKTCKGKHFIFIID